MNHSIKELSSLLLSTGEHQQLLQKKAQEIRNKALGPHVYFRGLIELSNICSNDCYYCGIRKSNHHVQRYSLDIDTVLRTAKHAYGLGFRSLVIQSGERQDPSFIDSLCNLLSLLKTHMPDIHITLSSGEQTKDDYQRLKNAGADRYLLRIETTNEELYKTYHPESMSLKKRKQCLQFLRDCDYQVGTGVLIGLPGQTPTDLAADLLFMQQEDIDMVGMGPYVHHAQTPLGICHPELARPDANAHRLMLTYNMISLLRILMPTINIASTTALSALDPLGQRMGLLAGANVLMPQTTPPNYRSDYQLYEGKPNLEIATEESLTHMQDMIKELGLITKLSETGDPKHYYERRKKHNGA